MPAQERKFIYLFTIFIASIAILNVLSAKLFLFQLGPIELAMSCGMIAYWLTFPVTDVVGEIFGKTRAQLVVWMGFLANIIVLFFSQVAVVLPPATEIYKGQEAFATVLGSVPVIIFASLAAYLISQLHDTWAFEFWKKKTKGKHLWLRNNASTISSQFIDSFIFNGIAFGIFGDNWLGFGYFFKMFIGYWLFKVFVAMMDTPIVYLLIHWMKADHSTQEQ